MAPLYDSCHHQDTTYGDTFGGIGTCKEYHEEEIPRLRPAPFDAIDQLRVCAPELVAAV